jgi:hypothetical protein
MKTVSNHAVERYLERFYPMLDINIAKNKILSLANSAIFLYQNRDGKIFYNNNKNIIIVTDKDGNIVKTVYSSDDEYDSKLLNIIYN